VYVSRWTTLHVRPLIRAFEEALQKRGFSFVEVIAPCPTLYTRRNKLGSGLDRMKGFQEAEVRNGASPMDAVIEFKGRLVVGKFVDIEKPTLEDTIDESMKASLGDAYTKLGVSQGLAERRALREPV
jgi:2-oxoglutarate ferredoxin oxidoreductase subunit beta